MALDAALPGFPTARALSRGLTARVGLTLVVCASFLLRVVAAGAHPAPRYFPDEYLYTALARAIGTGHAPALRGQPAHVPMILEPLLAAPFHALFSPEGAYRLTQIENALFMSLAAVPVYLLARRLSLSTRYALACALFTVAIPDLIYASYTLADPVAFPLVLAALCSGVAALERPQARTQIAFLVFAALATLARIQYVVLPLAFLAGALVLDRRAVLRRHRLPLAMFALPALAALALGPSRILGIYAPITHLHVNGQFAKWALLNLFLLAFSTGIVLTPGAVVALARPRGRTETAFALLAVTFVAGVVSQGALFGSNGLDRFPERYVFTILPLIPLAFGLYLKHGRPGRSAVVALSCLLFIAAARIPLAGFAAATGRSDSPFLAAVARIEELVGTANGSLVLSLAAALGAAGAFAVSRGLSARVALGSVVAFMAAASATAVAADARGAQAARDSFVAPSASWIDAAGVRDVTLVMTPGASNARSIEQLYWNRSVTREVTLGGAAATDPYVAVPRVAIAADGTMRNVGSTILFESYGATAQFDNAALIASFNTFRLLSAEGAPRLSLLEWGRYSDGWLAPRGRLTIWPDRSGRTRGTVRFSLALPPSARAERISFGRTVYDVEPGARTDVTLSVDARGPWTLPFSSANWVRLPDLRHVSVRSTRPIFRRSGARPRASRSQA
ncbi:MAG: hypothetical protein JWO17_2624 [Actinomycetia bacterium]|nr:hypothetical protein [Actinomycetes bacterium]